MSPTHYQDREERARGYLKMAAIFALFPAMVSAILLRYGVEMPGMHWFTMGACTVVLFTLIWWWNTCLPSELGQTTLQRLDAELQLVIHGDPEVRAELVEQMSDIELRNRALRLEWLKRWLDPIDQIHADEQIVEVQIVQRNRKQLAEFAEHEARASRLAQEVEHALAARPAVPSLQRSHRTATNSVLQESDRAFLAALWGPSAPARPAAIRVEEVTRMGLITAIAQHHTVHRCEADTLALNPADLPMLRSFCRDELPSNLQPQYFQGCHVLNLVCEYAPDGFPTHVYRKQTGQSGVLFSALMQMTRDTDELFDAVREQAPEPEPEGPRLRRFDL